MLESPLTLVTYFSNFQNQLVLVTYERIWKNFVGARPWGLKPVDGSVCRLGWNCTLQCSAVLLGCSSESSSVQCSEVQCLTQLGYMQCSAVQCSAVQCSVVQCSDQWSEPEMRSVGGSGLQGGLITSFHPPMYCTLYTAHYTLHTPHTIHSTILYTIHSSQYTPQYCTLYTPHNTLHKIQYTK